MAINFSIVAEHCMDSVDLHLETPPDTVDSSSGLITKHRHYNLGLCFLRSHRYYNQGLNFLDEIEHCYLTNLEKEMIFLPRLPKQDTSPAPNLSTDILSFDSFIYFVVFTEVFDRNFICSKFIDILNCQEYSIQKETIASSASMAAAYFIQRENHISPYACRLGFISDCPSAIPIPMPLTLCLKINPLKM